MRRISVTTRREALARLSGMAVLGGAVLMLIAFLAAGCGLGGSGGGSVGSGDTAPDFQLTTLAGDQASLGIYRGKPLVLAFMASW